MELNETIRLIMRLDNAVNRINGAYYLWARRHSLKENMLTLLYALDDGERHTQMQLARDWLIPKTTVNTLVKELVDGGYAALTFADGKTKEISLTASGEAYAKQALGALYRAELDTTEEVVAKHGDGFVRALSEYADLLCKNLGTDK